MPIHFLEQFTTISLMKKRFDLNLSSKYLFDEVGKEGLKLNPKINFNVGRKIKNTSKYSK